MCTYDQCAQFFCYVKVLQNVAESFIRQGINTFNTFSTLEMSILPGNIWIWIHQDTNETEKETVLPFHKLFLK